MAAKKKPAKPKPPAAKTVACWEDDPGTPGQQPLNSPINVPVPNQAAQPLAFKIGGTAPTPAIYQAGTANFRYYAAAAALRRTADFWGAILPGGTKWHVGSSLPVILDDGVDLNAFYTRG